jgi:hypothetical protein
MRVAYASTDEVNQALAARMADECGAIICHLRPGEMLPDGLFDAVLYNLDDLPREQRPAFLEGLCLDSPHCPTAVHGYGIAHEQAQALSRPGIFVLPRLDPALLRSLCKAARQSRATVRSDSAPKDLTWVDLAN